MVTELSEVNILAALAHRYRDGQAVFGWGGSGGFGALDDLRWDNDESSVPKPTAQDLIDWENDRLDKLQAEQAAFDDAQDFLADALSNGASISLLRTVGEILGALRPFATSNPPSLDALYTEFVAISNGVPGIQTAAQNFATEIFGVSTFVANDMTAQEKQNAILAFLLITLQAFTSAWANYTQQAPPGTIPSAPYNS